ncbi:hypothetical protein Cpir12675_004495 [Ceratocystis pirilliformis]|uniref:Uncharacterized protein n=1 Tax=Ceratocystis pirilliformis TaxID=259994 RepID=A0ABR3YW12_9PEZI
MCNQWEQTPVAASTVSAANKAGYWKNMQGPNMWVKLAIPCLTFGRTHQRLIDVENGESGLDSALRREGLTSCIECFGASMFAERQRIRHRLGIPGSKLTDFTASCFCPCVVVQEHERTVFEHCVETSITTQPTPALPMTLGDPNNCSSFITIPEAMFSSPRTSDVPQVSIPHLYPGPRHVICQLYESGQSSSEDEYLVQAKADAAAIIGNFELDDTNHKSLARLPMRRAFSATASISTIEEEGSDDTIAVGVPSRDTWPNSRSDNAIGMSKGKSHLQHGQMPLLQRKPHFISSNSLRRPNSASDGAARASRHTAPSDQEFGQFKLIGRPRNWSPLNRDSDKAARLNFLDDQNRESSNQSDRDREVASGMSLRLHNVRRRWHKHVRAISEPRWSLDEMKDLDKRSGARAATEGNAEHYHSRGSRSASQKIPCDLPFQANSSTSSSNGSLEFSSARGSFGPGVKSFDGGASSTGGGSETGNGLDISKSQSQRLSYGQRLSNTYHSQNQGHTQSYSKSTSNRHSNSDTTNGSESVIQSRAPSHSRSVSDTPRARSLPDMGMAVEDGAYLRKMRVTRFLAH